MTAPVLRHTSLHWKGTSLHFLLDIMMQLEDDSDKHCNTVPVRQAASWLSACGAGRCQSTLGQANNIKTVCCLPSQRLSDPPAGQRHGGDLSNWLVAYLRLAA